ncbi:nucleoside deaminase [Glycomyces luteolus]|uniref:tRNA-specific adenosine deaminase n=1 Tax=Glycomyces luteolus TaxID=2670330 RepID=A0A9X3PEW5_9ACTN|nr:nucleoside deaminase [Glycomyces luteolus]MDA1362228.1 nucleoside deaminase [Glycomyces luteolus]
MQSRREVHERWMRRALEIARTGGLPADPEPHLRPGGPAYPADTAPPDVTPAAAQRFDADNEDVPAEHGSGASAGPRGDLPVGALVIGPDGRELAAAANAREALGDPTAHAEVLALRAAAAAHGDGWRLEGCTLVVTLEPCTMCAGAAVLARVGEIVFGAWEPKTGAVGSLWDVVRDPRLNHNPDVYGGILEAESAALLRAYFGRSPNG